MCHYLRVISTRWCALALALYSQLAPCGNLLAQPSSGLLLKSPVDQGDFVPSHERPALHLAAMPVTTDVKLWPVGDPQHFITEPDLLAQAAPNEEVWIAPPADRPRWTDPASPPPEGEWEVDPDLTPLTPAEFWYWQVLPDGLIYRSYWAGVREPRLAVVAFDEKGSQAFWDGTLGGRVGLLRYGTRGGLFPQGWQLDVEAAAIVRLTLDEIRDFETADYRVGVPLTYGIDNWQFKFAVYHLSSHLGDEFAIANPGSLDQRINYVRDALVLGVSYYPHPALRLYSEAAYAANADGGAEPWEFQFGAEVSRPGPTGPHGTPFWAINGHLREEHDFGGDVSTQIGLLWRGRSGQVTRAGLHYYNGKSSQYQTFDESEQQIGFGLWYDF
jgi:hypothetical protein